MKTKVKSVNKDVARVSDDECDCTFDFLLNFVLKRPENLILGKCQHCKKLSQLRELILKQAKEEE